MNQPWVPFDAYLAGGIGGQLAWVIAPSMIAAESKGTNHPIGTGPFVFQDWVVNDHFTATKNPHYWRRASLSRQHHLQADSRRRQSRDAALASGAVQAMHTDDPQSIQKFRSRDEHRLRGRLRSRPRRAGHGLHPPEPRQRHPSTSCLFRQAVVMAIDLASYKTAINFGHQPDIEWGVHRWEPLPARKLAATRPTTRARLSRIVKQLKSQRARMTSFTLGTTPDQSSVRACTYIQSELAHRRDQLQHLGPAGPAGELK